MYYRFYLKNFKGGLHLSRGIPNRYDRSEKDLSSDRIQSALFAAALQLFDELADPATGLAFMNSFRLSSAFPFWEDKKEGTKIRLYPKPASFPYELPFKLDELKDSLGLTEKELKKISFLEEGCFFALLKGENLNDLALTADYKLLYSKSKCTLAVWEKLEELKAENKGLKVQKTDIVDHVHLEQGVQATPYSMDKIFFEEEAGLFFILQTENEDSLKKVKAAFRLLADQGIGTDRSTGHGHFEAEIEAQRMNIKKSEKKSQHYISLGTYSPSKEELNQIELKDSYYQLGKLRGYISIVTDCEAENNASGFRKAGLYVFETAACLQTEFEPQGQVHNLNPKETKVFHPVWRATNPIMLPIFLSKTEA
ncbi:type III-A CRISPR-associated RAMP protein Csm4 [Saprospira sp. CCB-QB6]|uniref:type III-A CRISPR-associated RAMP protein Csm4 n=1 Tax=Saprospira sp. CCB-QB6 TaxID=3023936 RepID=UPI00234A1261|nr:type III-A CRISPR-associated RAMP protein Csm4 [Saprospira sp. CCB-QB6]WCL81676.1 type III-A CRISPR-associated RAMP protein Csm4 [Saprospira sp. CCB-QB6]